MFILAKEEKGVVYAYNNSREQVLCERGKLYQYTDSTVAIERQGIIYIYGENGKIITSYPEGLVDISNIAGVVL